jgi:biopolymer transport protein ExbB
MEQAIRTGMLRASWAAVAVNSLLATVAQAQDTTAQGASAGSLAEALRTVFSGGVTGVTIMVLLAVVSIIALALVVEHLLTIRRSVLMPDGLAETVRGQLSKNDLPAANRSCQQAPSALADVLQAGFTETVGGWPAVEKALEESLAEQSARLLRKIDYLSVIGNIAPMIGLLGTVFGMIFAFQEVANTQGAARAAELASGIYEALITTVGGLMVAIPSLAAFAVFRNRVDQLIAETARQAQVAIGPVKRALLARGLPTATALPRSN